MLAGVSTDYYVRLEQGRERHPSHQVLDALTGALLLEAEAAEYLRRSAADATPRRRLGGDSEAAAAGLVGPMNATPGAEERKRRGSTLTTARAAGHVTASSPSLRRSSRYDDDSAPASPVGTMNDVIVCKISARQQQLRPLGCRS